MNGDVNNKKSSFRGRRASDDYSQTIDALLSNEKSLSKSTKKMKVDSAAFVPKGCDFQMQEIDQFTVQSDSTKANSENDFEEGATDDSEAMREYNNYCEATRKKQKKNFANLEERQEFNQTVEMKRKTEMCKNIIHFGECKFGSNCSYAHSKDELLKKKHV